jgi:hypothetical protein
MTVLIAAVTAAAVALVIDRYRAERAWRQVLSELLSASGMLPLEDSVGNVPGEETRRRAALLDLSRRLEAPPYDLAMKNPEVAGLVARTAGLLQGLLIAGDRSSAVEVRSRDLNFRTACETAGGGLLDYLGHPRWAVRRRTAALQRVRAFHEALDNEADPAPG